MTSAKGLGMGFKPGLRVFLVFMLLAGALQVAQAADGFPTGDRKGPLPPRVRNLLHHRSAPLRNDGADAQQAVRLAGEKAPASLNAILVMCDFSDSLMFGRYGKVEGDFPPPMQSEFYYDAHDSVYFDHLMQDVTDYYTNVSGGEFTLNFTVYPRTVNLPHPMWFFGDHPDNGEQPVLMARDVVDSLDAEIDFSLYDTVILVHAGAGEETDILGNSPEQIYSNYLNRVDFEEAVEDSVLENPWIPSADFPPGQGIDKVLVLPETEYQDPIGGFGGFFGSLGVYCFEMGLRLGMLSLSDFTPGGNPDSQGIGEFGLMGYGLFVGLGWIPPHPCAFNKQFMGWLNPREVDPLSYRALHLTPCERTRDPGAALRVNISGQEYWLLAYRLQDPDGNRIFTHPGDLNGNNVPDFYDADSEYGDGTPTGVFDPDTDTRERLLDCEWDFFMSENNARQPYDKGAGSGIYVWHVDESVIQDVFHAETNLFNADPARKSVDLEEADSIQDLDSRQPSDFMLGGDDDSFRGEDAAHFGPATVPDTRTAQGVRTGIKFADFSKVVLDSNLYLLGVDDSVSPPDSVWAFQYADTVTFNLFTEYDVAGGPYLKARRTLNPGVDLAGSHALTADLDLAGDTDEIILTGVFGNIFVLDGDLNEFLDRDDDPDTFAPFARGLQDNAPVQWNQPAALGDLDHDGEPEIVLTGPNGIFAFNADASPVLDLDPQGEGLYRALDSCDLPPVLIPADFTGDYAPDVAVNVCVVETLDGVQALSLYGGANGDPVQRFSLGPLRTTAPPVWVWNHLAVTVADTAADVAELRLIDPSGSPDPSQHIVFPLTGMPGLQPPLAGLVDPSDPGNSLRYLVVTDETGRGETVVFDADFRAVMENILWPESVSIASGQAPGGAFVGPDGLGRAGHNGAWYDGWPVTSAGAGAAHPDRGAAGALVARLAGSDLPLDQYILPTLDGRVFGLGTQGETAMGWPVSGPAKVAGTPALGWMSGPGQLDLVTVGTFPRILGLNDATGDLATGAISTISLFEAVADSGAVWPMWGGSPWRNGAWNMTAWATPPGAAAGTGIVSGSHKCYPSPLGSGPLFVRGSLRAPGRVQVIIHNLEGEEVTRSGWQSVSARDPFAVQVDLPQVVTGLYLCRLVADTGGGEQDVSLKQFAVVR